MAKTSLAVTADRTAAAGEPMVAPATTPRVRPAERAPSPWWDWLVVLALVTLFVAIAGHQWRLPGLYNDEAYDVIPAMQLVLGQPVDLNRGVGLHVFGYDLPLMISDYQGATSAYAVLPLFALFGVGVGPLRALTIGFGALALPLCYLLGRRLYGRPAGLLAAVLLAVSPSLIFWSRIGVYVVIQVVPLASGVLLAGLRWRRTRRARWLALAGLLAGLGLSTKVLFIWFIAGIVAAGVAVWLVNWWWPYDAVGRPLRRRSWRAHLAEPSSVAGRDLLAAAGGFLLGAAPLLAYNLASGGTFKVLRANLGRTEKGVDNTAVAANFMRRLDNVQALLDGSYFWFLGGVERNPLAPPVVALAAAGLLALVCAVPAYRRYRDATVFALVLLAAIFVQSVVTVSGFEATHFLIVLPLPHLLVAAFAALLGRHLTMLAARRGASSAMRVLLFTLPVVTLLGPLAAGDLAVDRRYHRALATTGGRDSFSDRIYELAFYLDRYRFTRPYALDWGMKHNIELLTHGRVQPQELYGQTRQPPPEFYARLEALLSDPATVYIAHRDSEPSNPAAYPGRVAELRRLANARGKDLIVLKVINQGQVQDPALGGSGGPLFYVYVARDR